MLVLVGRTDLPRGAKAGAGPGWLAGGGAPGWMGLGEQRWGWGAPRALDWGTKVLITLLLLYFSLVGGSVQHGRDGETVGRLSHPAPLGPRARRPLRQHGGENKALGRPASAGAGV